MIRPVVAFRTDAATHIGLGHLMRCLTLADALAAWGWRCVFIMRRLPGRPPQEHFTDRGHDLQLLPAPGDGETDDWLRVPMERDAAETRAALAAITPDWVVVDHYGLDAAWEQDIIANGCRIFVIDDLADRSHACDMLLDQTFGRQRSDYTGLVPDHARLLLGTDFALLRPEFAVLRPKALADRQARLERGLGQMRLLVALGGYDEQDITSRALDGIAKVIADGVLPPPVVDVVLSSRATHLATVKARLPALPYQTRLHVDTRDMARLIADADLGIGAGGTTAWERACLGLPCLLVVLAENQSGIVGLMDAEGAAVTLGTPSDPGFDDRFRRALAEVIVPETLFRIGAAVRRLVDGGGVESVVDALRAADLTCRTARPTDSYPVWTWRHADGGNRFYRDPSAVPFEGHDRWFKSAIADPARRLLIVDDAAQHPVAHVRLDLNEDGASGSVSIVIAPEARGTGIGRLVLRHGIWEAERAGLSVLRAEIHVENTASLRIFTGAGFHEVAQDLPFMHVELKLSQAEARPRM